MHFPNLVAANDNDRSATEHRAVVAAIMSQIPAIDSDIKPSASWPTATRLSRSRKVDLLRTLMRYRELLRLAEGSAANDNFADLEATPETTPDCGIEIRPTVGELQDAWGGYEAPDARAEPEYRSAGATIHRLRGTRFDDSMRLVEYTDRSGKWRRPVERPKMRHSSGASTAWAPSSIPGAVQFIEARDYCTKLRGAIGPYFNVLDMACGDATAEEIGELFGAREKSAERLGVNETDKILRVLTVASSLDGVVAA